MYVYDRFCKWGGWVISGIVQICIIANVALKWKSRGTTNVTKAATVPKPGVTSSRLAFEEKEREREGGRQRKKERGGGERETER